VRGYGVRLSWNVLSFVPVIAAAVVLIGAQRRVRRFLQTTHVQSVADAQNIFVIVFGARMAPALASTAVGPLQEPGPAPTPPARCSPARWREATAVPLRCASRR
jgi:hypothetical protein